MPPPDTERLSAAAAVIVAVALCAVIGAAAPLGTCCAWPALPALLLYEEAPRRYLDSDPGGGRLLPVDVDAIPDEAAVEAVPMLAVPSAVPEAQAEAEAKNEALLPPTA